MLGARRRPGHDGPVRGDLCGVVVRVWIGVGWVSAVCVWCDPRGRVRGVLLLLLSAKVEASLEEANGTTQRPDSGGGITIDRWTPCLGPGVNLVAFGRLPIVRPVALSPGTRMKAEMEPAQNPAETRLGGGSLCDACVFVVGCRSLKLKTSASCGLPPDQSQSIPPHTSRPPRDAQPAPTICASAGPPGAAPTRRGRTPRRRPRPPPPRRRSPHRQNVEVRPYVHICQIQTIDPRCHALTLNTRITRQAHPRIRRRIRRRSGHWR